MTVNRTDLGRAIHLLSLSQYGPGLRLLLKSSKAAKKAAVWVLCGIVRKEIVEFCKAVKQKDRDLKAMLDFTWESIISDAKQKCPSALDLLIATLTTKLCHKTVSKKGRKNVISLIPVVGSFLSVISQIRSRHSGILQLMVSLMLWIGGCKRKVNK